MSNLRWIHPTDIAWHYGELREDGQIEDGDFGSVTYYKGNYSCTSTKTKGDRCTKNLETAKRIVEDMLK